MAEETMTPKQAAAAIDVSDQTIYNWIAAGVFQGVLERGVFKKRYRIPISEVERVKKLGNYDRPITGNSNAHYANA
jgi:excisionase family DNA binding protein